jgi:hypothetical protein
MGQGSQVQLLLELEATSKLLVRFQKLQAMEMLEPVKRQEHYYQ